MNQESLLEEEYREAAERHGTNTISGDYKKTNKAYDDLVKVLHRMRQLDDRGESILLRAAQDHTNSVACWAATHLLPLSEQEAIKVLERIASGQGPIAFDAEMVLEEWRAGRLTVE